LGAAATGEEDVAARSTAAVPGRRDGRQRGRGPRRRSYKEQRELDLLPATIERLEAEIAAIHVQVAEPAFYKQPAADIAATQRFLKDREAELAAAFRRWEELEERL
jgi:ATP-binding cassette subfamily F protein uup